MGFVKSVGILPVPEGCREVTGALLEEEPM